MHTTPVSQLHIQTALSRGKTVLTKAYHTAPFKIVTISEDKSCPTLKLMLMTSSPGILDGDRYEINVEAGSHCNLELQTQSYQRLFSMEKGASQNMEVHLLEGASFTFLPHPCVPHKASVFAMSTNISLSGGCTLTWGEVLTCGRKLSGEAFTFTRFHSITKVYLHNKLVIKENLLLQPAEIEVSAFGQLEGYTHQSSLLYINETTAVNELIPTLQEMLTNCAGICFGISALPVNGIIVRMLGYKAEQLYNLHKKMALTIANITGRKAVQIF